MHSYIKILLNYESNVDPKSGFIQTLCRTPQGHWTRGRKIVQAVNGSSIAAIVRDSNTIMDAVYVYYQGLDLHVRERVWSPDAGRWVSSKHFLAFILVSEFREKLDRRF